MCKKLLQYFKEKLFPKKYKESDQENVLRINTCKIKKINIKDE